MKKWFRGLLSFILVLVLVFSLAPTTALADPDAGAGEGNWGGSGGQYYVEWLPVLDSGELLALQMHLFRARDGQNFTGLQCRALRDGEWKILSDYAAFSQIDPSGLGDTLDGWLTKAEELGYNGNERRENHLNLDAGYNDCYALWTVTIPPDAEEGQWAIYVNLTAKPRGTWGYFVDTDGSNGLNGNVDTYEFGIKPGETRTLPDGFWQANWQERGDSSWGSYTECVDVGSSMWPAKTTDGETVVDGLIYPQNARLSER